MFYLRRYVVCFLGILFLDSCASPLRGTPQGWTPPLKSGIEIVIDPGHGGKEKGTFSKNKPKVYEKNFNLRTAIFLKKYLQDRGFQAVMTRTSDMTLSLEKRVAFAKKQSPRLFVSVHYNSAPSSQAEGVEVFFFDDKTHPERRKRSKVLAEIVLKNILAETHAKSRGVKSASFFVIRETSVPAILVEGGFLTHAEELKKIKTSAYQQKIAEGIAKGIEAYCQEYK